MTLRGRLLLIGTALAGAMAPALAQPSEEAVKAAFLPRFARYVSWPAGSLPPAAAPFTLCVVGRDPFGPLLDRAAGAELIDGHRVAVRRMTSPAQSGGCHLA